MRGVCLPIMTRAHHARQCLLAKESIGERYGALHLTKAHGFAPSHTMVMLNHLDRKDRLIVQLGHKRPELAIRKPKTVSFVRNGPRTRVARRDLDSGVHLYGVAGRQRTAVASAMMKMLRAYDWSRLIA